MGRLRKYESDAARKAAQRERDKAEWVQVPRAVHEAHAARLEALQRAVNDAARRGDAVAVRCRAASVDTVLENLTKYFELEK
jgi:N-acetylglucosamine kinase-like BadF-type ATPase